MRNSVEIGAEFEDEVKIFLKETLGFSDVKGGPNFHIAPEGEKNQIDAAARYENILFVFECTASARKNSSSLRKKILETREKSRMVFENYKSIPEYKNCSYVRFIFITKKRDLPETEISLCNENPLWYADEHLISYYTDLSEKVGKFAIYNFLSEFKIGAHPKESVSLPVMQTEINGFEVYNFFAKPSELIKFSYVGRRRSLKENFYQRILDKHRIKKIQKYISDGGMFPTNIILSLRSDGITFKKSNSESEGKSSVNFGTLTIAEKYDACWIIDGQHRFYSMALSGSDDLVPCLAFKGINVETERGFFLDINKEQKPISPDLVWDLEGLANPNSYKGIISNVVHTLAKKPIFLDKIYIPVNGEKVGRQINMAAFCNGISNSSIAKQEMPNCYGINPLYDEVSARMTKRIAVVLERYYAELDIALSDLHKGFVFGNAGIPITLYLLEPIVSYIHRPPGRADFKTYAEFISDYLNENFGDEQKLKELKLSLNSEGARKGFAQDIGRFLRAKMKIKKFWFHLEDAEILAEAISMERKVGKFIAEQLNELSPTWRVSRVPQQISLKARSRAETEGTRFDENLSFGDEIQIITVTNNWKEVFEGVFLGQGRFQNIEEVKLAFQYISKIRNSGAHGKSTHNFEKSDIDQYDIYMQKLEKVIPETDDI